MGLYFRTSHRVYRLGSMACLAVSDNRCREASRTSMVRFAAGEQENVDSHHAQLSSSPRLSPDTGHAAHLPRAVSTAPSCCERVSRPAWPVAN